ncbi:MAG: TolC family protein [Betaproteobacteria bacterium]|nr:TolC family protein [Betaproteobacteria bacterium]
MRYRRFLTAAAVAAALGIPPVSSVSWGAPGLDPHNLEARTAPAPNQPWISDQPLPQVPASAAMQAAPAGLNGPVSLAQLTDLALRLNARTRQAWLQARAEAATLGVERADEWPQINALLSHNLGRPISGTTGTASSVQTRYGPNVTLSYVLFDFGQRAANIEAANYRLLAANLAQNRVLQEVAFQVEQAYYRVLAFDYLVRASRESLTKFETALDAAQRRRSSGLATAGDEYRAETQVGQARLSHPQRGRTVEGTRPARERGRAAGECQAGAAGSIGISAGFRNHAVDGSVA